MLLVFTALTGCTSPLMQIDKDLASQGVREYHFDFSKTTATGKILIHTKPISQQLAVQEYGIKINGGETIKVLKRSKVEIILDEGSYKLEIFALAFAGQIFYGDVFGKPSFKEINIKAGETRILEYTGPFGVISSGSLKEI